MQIRKLGFVIALLLSTTAHAGLTVEDYHKIPRGDARRWDLVVGFLTGIGQGLETANSFLDHEHKTKLYCQPDIALNGQNYVQILDDYIESSKTPYDPKVLPVSTLMFYALVVKFPCK